MTAVLQVSQVRSALYVRERAAEGGDGRPSLSVLGSAFHETIAMLVSDDCDRNLDAALADADGTRESQHRELVRHVYQHLIGPRLAAHQALLATATEQTLDFWAAAHNACDWLLDLSAVSRRNTRSFVTFTHAELPLEWELTDPEWTDSVRLVGIADLCLQLPHGPTCVVELKLGQTSPAADLAQACLYQRMLRAAVVEPTVVAELAEPQQNACAEPDGAGAQDGGAIIASRDPSALSLAVVRFLPDLSEHVYSQTEIDSAWPQLKQLIGTLAGVANQQLTTSAPAEPAVLAVPLPKTDSSPAATVFQSASQEQHEQGRQLVATFREYGAPLDLDGGPRPGPTFIRYPVRLGQSVKLSSVRSRAVEVQMRLGLAEPPMINLTDGQVVIDVQRSVREYVKFSQIRHLLPPSDVQFGCSKLLIGMDLDGHLRFADLADPESSHLLVAGTTGSGKSEWLRSTLAGLLVTNTPDTLQLVLVDPKRNAFHDLKDSPFLRRPIVYPEVTSTVKVLHDLVEEMDRRYAKMAGADSFADHARQSGASIPRIILVCDEYFDLISRSREERREIEDQIFRLGAKARAAGIHLILATQQPGREVIRGALDANITARVGLKMSKSIESRTLLQTNGAECLLGNGDLLYKSIGNPVRLQSPWLPPDERRDIFNATMQSNATVRPR